MAPFMPFLSEAVYQNLVRGMDAHAPLSVHMADWPTHQPSRLDRPLLAEMQVVQRVIALGRSARNDSKLKVRQPLARLLVRAPDESAAAAVTKHAELIREELNVKAIELIPRDAELVTYRIRPNLPVVGKRYGKFVPAIRRALTEGPVAEYAATVARGETLHLTIDGEAVALEPAALLVDTTSAEGFACAEAGGYLVGLDTRLNKDLVLEGLARELVRTVQDARKQAGLSVSDRISLYVTGDSSVSDALATHRSYLMNETLATEWKTLPSSAFTSEHTLGDSRWTIQLQKA
jgi:isoleucyl-tRNA synthetase